MMFIIALLYIATSKKDRTCLSCQFENILKEQDD